MVIPSRVFYFWILLTSRLYNGYDTSHIHYRGVQIATVIYFNKFEMKLSHENSSLIYLPEKCQKSSEIITKRLKAQNNF